ncbi:hypothetical protein DFH06DRAFT_1229035 [Mycena polygramma]|nr:hypothetical protein DFH06DRAFT_1229035 [Mycena polygramma]
MELPLEIIESIIDAVASGIDEDPWMLDRSPDTLATLRSCALVARSLLCRSQIHIFFGIALCGQERIPPSRLSTVLTESPHLASYVRALHFGSSFYIEDPMAASVAHILSSVTNLERLAIFPGPNWMLESVRDAFLLGFALPHLRHLSFMGFYFADLFALQERLAACPSLKSFMMHTITFTSDTDLTQRTKASPRLVLDTLHLWYFDQETIQLMLDTFTAVDITHLRWLLLRTGPVESLLSANAATVQRLDLIIEDDDITGVPAHALAHTHALQTLKLAIHSLSALNVLVRQLGPLTHLKDLHTISVNVTQWNTTPAEWRELDGLLDTAPALVEVNVYSGFHVFSDEPDPKFMPGLAARGIRRTSTSQIGYMADLPPQ